MINLQLFASDLLVSHNLTLEIDTTPTSTATWVRLGRGFDNISEALNETVNQYMFLDNGGFSQSFVTGMAPVITLTGVRIKDDPAQNFIFDKKYELLDNRTTNFRIRYTDGSNNEVTITLNDCTLANLSDFSGASADGSVVNVEIHFSQKPVVSGGDLLGALTVVSVAGGTTGETSIYVNPALTSGNSYRYRLGNNLSLPAYGADVSSYTSWDGSADIAATNGQDIVVVEATSGNLARKAGKAVVTVA